MKITQDTTPGFVGLWIATEPDGSLVLDEIGCVLRAGSEADMIEALAQRLDGPVGPDGPDEPKTPPRATKAPKVQPKPAPAGKRTRTR